MAYRVACSARSTANRRRFHERRLAEQGQRQTAGESDRDLGLRAILDQELSLLPERNRAVVILCDLEGLTYEQAAQALGWPMGTVKSRLARGDRLRSRLIRRGVAPALAIVAGLWSRDAAGARVSTVLLQSTVDLAMSDGLGPFKAIAISSGVFKLTEGAMMSILMTKAKLSLAVMAIGSCLVATAAFFASPGLGAAAQESRDAGSLAGGEGKPVTDHALTSKPRAPWETVVRIRVQAEGAVRFGSGTVIQSSPEESLILTCAHTFRPDGELAPPPDRFPWKIMVDLFDGKLQGEHPAHVKFDVTTEGKLVDHDLSRDVGLIRIRPGRTLPASRVVPKRWQPRLRHEDADHGLLAKATTDGLAHDRHQSRLRGLADNTSYEAIECKTAPKQGRTGGGLFTTDGYLAGVCNYAEPRGDAGLYASPRSIYVLLDRNGLASLHGDRSTESAPADADEPVFDDEPPAGPPGQPGTLEELKDKLARAKVQNEALSAEVLQLRRQLSFYHDALQVSVDARAARSVEGKEKPIGAKLPPSAPPQPVHPSPAASSPGSAAGAQREPFLRSGGLIFAASPTGNKLVAHDPITRKEQAVLLNATRENPLEVRFKGDEEVVGLDLKGTRITRTAAYDHRAGAWIPLDLSEPVGGELKARMTGDSTIIYDAGRHHYTYSIQAGKWDHFDLGTITDTLGEGAGTAKPAQ